MTGVQTCALPIYCVTIDKEVYEGFRAISEADSVTIDPHKMGYVPYAAGGIVIKRSEERRVGKECRSRWSAYH